MNEADYRSALRLVDVCHHMKVPDWREVLVVWERLNRVTASSAASATQLSALIRELDAEDLRRSGIMAAVMNRSYATSRTYGAKDFVRSFRSTEAAAAACAIVEFSTFAS